MLTERPADAMKPSVSCELWTPWEGLAVNYTPACFGPPSSAQGITTSILHAPLSLCFTCFFYCETPRLKNLFFTHRSMGPFVTGLAWTADELEHKQLLCSKNPELGYSDFKANNAEKGECTKPPPLFGGQQAVGNFGMSKHPSALIQRTDSRGWSWPLTSIEMDRQDLLSGQ